MFPPNMAMLSLDEIGIDLPISLTTVAETIYDRAVTIAEREGSLSPVVFMFTKSAVYLLEASEFFEEVSTQKELAGIIRKLTHETAEIVAVAVVAQGFKRVPGEPLVEIVLVQCEWHDGSQKMFSGNISRELPDGAFTTKVSGPEIEDSYTGIFSTLFSPTKQDMYLN